MVTYVAPLGRIRAWPSRSSAANAESKPSVRPPRRGRPAHPNGPSTTSTRVRHGSTGDGPSRELMTKYGNVALRAAALIEQGESPPDAWRVAAREVFPGMEPSQKKGCPKGAFLGLCEDGLVLGVPRGRYTQSRDNKAYAITAVAILKGDPSLASRGAAALWGIVMRGREKKPNHQMDVVLALWDAGTIVGGPRIAD
jgi:hypothetical protein